MNLKTNTNLIGQHAFLSPSNYHWLDYDEDKHRRVYFQKQQARRGDQLHVFAQDAINLKISMPDNGTTLSMYINDAIGFRMEPEVPLKYSDECFGTADAVGCREEAGVLTLRIHDLKTGVHEADMRQLKIYAALFCFQFNFKPTDLLIILRIYQNDAVVELVAEPADIFWVMDRVRFAAAQIKYLREED